MKKFLCALVLIASLPLTNYGQSAIEGEVITKQFVAPSLIDNKGGEDPMRRLSIYLPPDYNTSQKRYPTIYFLHGFGVDDNNLFQWLALKQLLDKAIETKQIRPVIMILPNSQTNFGGSFYTNSSLTGNWSDYIAKDVVEYMDTNFRTIPNRNERALCGHSMGGNGALKIAMLFPDVFCMVYAMSPGVLDWAGDFSLENTGFEKINETKNATDIMEALNNFDGTGDFSTFYAAVLISLGRTYSPSFNESSKFAADFPVYWENDIRRINFDVKKKWEENFPINMIENHLPALQKLRAIKLDWGRNENFDHIPITALQFSKKLESLGIEHFAEEYIGDHVNKLDGFAGRIYTELLPFIERYLELQTSEKKE